jgi:hypothetical protein
VTESVVEINDGKYRVGERWHYRTRPGEEGSLLTILKVESSPRLGIIVHVSVDGLRIENPNAPGGVSDTIGHLPMAEQAVDNSVTAPSATNVVMPGQDEGYEEWRRAFDAGGAGIWTVTVADAIDHIAQMLRS